MSFFNIIPERLPVISAGTKFALPREEYSQPGKAPNKISNGAGLSRQSPIFINPPIQMAQPNFNQNTGTQNSAAQMINQQLVRDWTSIHEGQINRSNARGNRLNMSSIPTYYPQASPLLELAGVQPTSRNPLGVWS